MGGACHWATHWATQTRILRLPELLVAHWCAASLLLLPPSPPGGHTLHLRERRREMWGMHRGFPEPRRSHSAARESRPYQLLARLFLHLRPSLECPRTNVWPTMLHRPAARRRRESKYRRRHGGEARGPSALADEREDQRTPRAKISRKRVSVTTRR
jgi:hypothetical protein